MNTQKDPMNPNNITDLTQRRQSCAMMVKTVNAQRALTFCHTHNLTPIHVNIDTETQTPIIMIDPPEDPNLLTDPVNVGSSMMAKQLRFAGQPIAELIWLRLQ